MLAVSLIAGCNKEEKIKNIQLDERTLELYVADTYQFTVMYEPGHLPEPEYVWSSSNNTVATISGTGLLTAKGEGVTTITVVSPGTKLASACEVTILKQRATQIIINHIMLDLEKGQSALLSYSLTPEGSAISTAKWSSSDEKVATVTQNGMVTAVATGEVIITVCDVARPNIDAACLVKISQKQADNIMLNKERLTLLYNQEEILSYTLFPDNSVLRDPFWSSADSNIASVNQNGKVTGKSEGITVIQLYSTTKPDVKTFCEVTVVRPTATSIVLNRTELTLEKNAESHLTYTSLPEFSIISSVIWSSSNESVASVDHQGKVTPVTEGTAIITVTDASNPSIKAVCIVTITSISATEITFSMNEMELFVGDRISLNYTLYPNGAALSQPEWSSNNPQIASVDQEGKITGISKGTAMITLKDKAKPDVLASCKINVLNVEATSIVLNQSSLTIKAGDIFHDLKVSTFPQNATFQHYVWSSNDQWVATVDQNGTVKGLKVGTAIIRVEIPGGLFATCTVKVEHTYYINWEEPVLQFGFPSSVISAAEKRIKNNLSDQTGGLALMYNGEKNSRLQCCVYFFSANSMVAALLAFKEDDLLAYILTRTFCEERYELVETIGSKTIYKDKNGTTIEAGIEDIRTRPEFQNLGPLEKLAISTALRNEFGSDGRFYIISYSR